MKRDLLSRYVTLFSILLALGVLGYFFYMSSGSFLPAWLTILFGAIVALLMLSIPRKIVVSENYIEVHCLVEITKIPRKQITNIQPIKHKKLNLSFPIYGSWGVFGYYGLYFDLRTFKRFRLYATQRKNLIEITYGNHSKRLIISVPQSEEFLNEIL